MRPFKYIKDTWESYLEKRNRVQVEKLDNYLCDRFAMNLTHPKEAKPEKGNPIEAEQHSWWANTPVELLTVIQDMPKIRPDKPPRDRDWETITQVIV